MMTKESILIIDSNQHMRDFLRLKFEDAGYLVVTASKAAEALQQIQAQEPNLVVFDAFVDDTGAFNMLKQIRAISSVPVIVLSIKATSLDKVRGLNMGADDFMAKPFDPDELVARVRAISRRIAFHKGSEKKDCITLEDLMIDFNNQEASLDGKEIPLTRIERALLFEFAKNIDRLLLYEDLLTRIWGPEYRNDIQILRTWISRLRNKIGRNHYGNLISTVPKTGYIFKSTASYPPIKNNSRLLSGSLS
jgi:DNA-binding response OmpR family regulator